MDEEKLIYPSKKLKELFVKRARVYIAKREKKGIKIDSTAETQMFQTMYRSLPIDNILVASVYMNDKEIVSMALKEGANPNGVGKSSNSFDSIQMSARTNRIEIFKYLTSLPKIKSSAQYYLDNSRIPASILASMYGHHKIIAYMHDFLGIDLNEEMDASGMSIAHKHINHCQSPEKSMDILKTYHERDGKFNTKDEQGDPILHDFYNHFIILNKKWEKPLEFILKSDKSLVKMTNSGRLNIYEYVAKTWEPEAGRFMKAIIPYAGKEDIKKMSEIAKEYNRKELTNILNSFDKGRNNKNSYKDLVKDLPPDPRKAVAAKDFGIEKITPEQAVKIISNNRWQTSRPFLVTTKKGSKFVETVEKIAESKKNEIPFNDSIRKNLKNIIPIIESMTDIKNIQSVKNSLCDLDSIQFSLSAVSGDGKNIINENSVTHDIIKGRASLLIKILSKYTNQFIGTEESLDLDRAMMGGKFGLG